LRKNIWPLLCIWDRLRVQCAAPAVSSEIDTWNGGCIESGAHYNDWAATLVRELPSILWK
jgi:hypothetical protein